MKHFVQNCFQIVKYLKVYKLNNYKNYNDIYIEYI